MSRTGKVPLFRVFLRLPLELIEISFIQALEQACLRELSPSLHDEILSNLHKLSFTSMGSEVSLFRLNKKSYILRKIA